MYHVPNMLQSRADSLRVRNGCILKTNYAVVLRKKMNANVPEKFTTNVLKLLRFPLGGESAVTLQINATKTKIS